jgi:hypothetical protein
VLCLTYVALIAAPVEMWKKAALKKIAALKREYPFRISKRLFVYMVKEIHKAGSLETPLCRLLDTFDGDDETLLDMIKASFAGDVPATTNSSP